MSFENPGWAWVLKILFFPMLFQAQFIAFAWGAHDPTFWMIFKRIFILLPVSAIIVGLWASILAAISLLLREQRGKYSTAILITWWDLGRSILNFWMGIFKGVFVLVGGLVGLGRMLIMAVWMCFVDILLLPFRLIRGATSNLLTPGIPWIAVFMTVLWCVIESIIFTKVMTQTVIDVFSSITGQTLTEGILLQIPLFIFMMVIIMGSYAVLSNWATAIRSRDFRAILQIGAIELLAAGVEVMFLYREFVDSLVPWFAQHSEGFELSMMGIIGIAACAWGGIRGMSWFLFAAHGTPTILSIIQAAGIAPRADGGDMSRGNEVEVLSAKQLSLIATMFSHIKSEMDWVQSKTDEILKAFLLPPLQVIAAAINFCTLVFINKFLFQLPFKSIGDVVDSKALIQRIHKADGD